MHHIRRALPFAGPALYLAGEALNYKDQISSEPLAVKIEETPESRYLEKKFDSVVKKVGINKSVAVREIPELGLMACGGAAAFEYYRSEGARTIVLPPGLMNIDPHACSSVMKHELGHLKAQDAKIDVVVQISSSGIVAGIISRALRCIPRFQTLIAVVGAVASYFAPSVIRDPISRWQEGCADDFSIANCNEEENMGGWRDFHAHLAVNRKLRERLGPKLHKIISPEGAILDEGTHPSLLSRVKKLEQNMNKESLEKLSTEEERRKIETLSVYKYIAEIVAPEKDWLSGYSERNGLVVLKYESFETWKCKGRVTCIEDYTYNPQGHISTKSTHWKTPAGDTLEINSSYEYDGDEISNIVSTASGRFAREVEV